MATLRDVQFGEFRHQGCSEPDLAAASELGFRLLATDWSVFPHRHCPVRYAQSASPSTIARYIPEGQEGPEAYLVFVDGLDARLELEELTTVITHRWHGSDVSSLRTFVLDSLAVHEVRHRLQLRLAGDLRLYTTADLTADQAGGVRMMFSELDGIEKKPLETDARIVEYLRTRELLNQAVGPMPLSDAVWREPR